MHYKEQLSLTYGDGAGLLCQVVGKDAIRTWQLHPHNTLSSLGHLVWVYTAHPLCGAPAKVHQQFLRKPGLFQLSWKSKVEAWGVWKSMFAVLSLWVCGTWLFPSTTSTDIRSCGFRISVYQWKWTWTWAVLPVPRSQELRTKWLSLPNWDRCFTSYLYAVSFISLLTNKHYLQISLFSW